ncbi:unnamed protein product [Adineta ricciae]|uniref:Uncharacterized protein n=1 Tax=Adineta ricciae TaxID=249248 RepID=A0A815PKJ7_ADIRI|nr:unnamed protein product [Adineta ricciae]CAF1457336.1 unnamed protein product [Adineta ricciae]
MPVSLEFINQLQHAINLVATRNDTQSEQVAIIPSGTIDISAGENQLVELDHRWEDRIQKLTSAPNDPATWAEIHFNAFQNMIFVDISFIRGYNGLLVFTNSQGNYVLDATEPYTGGQNTDLISYYRSRVPIGQGYIVPDDHSSSHGTQDTHINLEIYS